jgi:proteasome lid subunit RPN8/RPN11
LSHSVTDRRTLTGVLRISQAYVDAIVAHARRDFPDEACGIVAGPEGSDYAARLIPMTNADRSPTFFRFDPAEQLALYREMEARDEEVVVVYHSHTSTQAYPSRTDISYAAEPQAHYLLVSVAETGAEDGPAEVRSYRILDGVVTEEEIEITSDQPLGAE